MNRLTYLLLLILTILYNEIKAQTNNHTNVYWPVCSPEEQGLSSVELNQMFDYIKQNQTRVHSIQILRHGYLILDAYFYPYDGQTRHDIASVTKSITSTLVGIAIDKNYIPDIKNNMLQYFPEYNITDTLKSKITLEDLITMRSGLDCGTDLSDPKINADVRLAEIRQCNDWIKCILDIPMDVQPGTKFAYCNANCQLLSAIIGKTTGMNASDFAQKELFEPLGIKDTYWPADNQGINHGWGDLQLYPYDMLKIGELMLHGGEINNIPLISKNWLNEATKAHVTHTGNTDQYGYYWWMPGDNYPGVYEAVGRGGQRITVWPTNDMVIVFTGGGFETSNLISFIVKAIKQSNALTANPEANQQLKNNLINAKKKIISSTTNKKLPPMAIQVSGKSYLLQTNTLALSEMSFSFSDQVEATINLIWQGKNVPCRTGLDGVERFSFNPLVRLPQACTAEWVNDSTFSMKLDLVGAINYYSLKVNFTEKGRKMIIDLNEGTGLNNERIIGELKN